MKSQAKGVGVNDRVCFSCLICFICCCCQSFTVVTQLEFLTSRPIININIIDGVLLARRAPAWIRHSATSCSGQAALSLEHILLITADVGSIFGRESFQTLTFVIVRQKCLFCRSSISSAGKQREGQMVETIRFSHLLRCFNRLLKKHALLF